MTLLCFICKPKKNAASGERAGFTKDDVFVMDQIGRFTLAQVTEMIRIAQEAQAVNVLALLLEYKNAHFADFDPMEEFTLEW